MGCTLRVVRWAGAHRAGFQLADLAADRRLGQPQCFRGCGEVACPTTFTNITISLKLVCIASVSRSEFGSGVNGHFT